MFAEQVTVMFRYCVGNSVDDGLCSESLSGKVRICFLFVEDLSMRCNLIVNADDLGWATGRDRGIFKSIESGIVTSVSLLANGTTFSEAVAELSCHQVGVGVHLNLTDGCALTGTLRGLTDKRGNFLGKECSRQVFAAQCFDRDAVYLELVAQVEKIIVAGVEIDHIDSHQHMFLFPALTPLMVKLCQQFKIKAVRLPVPLEGEEHDSACAVGDEMKVYRQLSHQFEQCVRRAKLFSPDGLWGMALVDRLRESSLLSLIDEVPAGCYELMVHPGYKDNGLPFCGVERTYELDALTSIAVRQRIEEREIKLTTFGAAQCEY
ncbi:MAG: hypothetical protein BA874_11230 [Desulfuromonadales bacterium C00003068]|nr:MAG: hypothetical protein BA874_11230 [Desulfuromonadales bacterium C00003068]